MEDLEIRRLFLDRAKEDLVGPKFGEEEIIDEWPIRRYQQGILWPSDVFTEDNDLDQEDSVEENDSEGTTQDKGTDLLRQKNLPWQVYLFIMHLTQKKIAKLVSP